MKTNQNGFSMINVVLAVVAVVVVLAVIGATWYFIKNSKCNSKMDKEICEKSGGKYHIYTVMSYPPGSGSLSSSNCECSSETMNVP